MTAFAARRAALAALALALAPAARAQVQTTNAQVRQGYDFHDPSAARDVKGGLMTTIAVSHFDRWSYGDDFFSVDMMQGQFTDGANSHLDGELRPRLFLDRIAGAKGPVLGILRGAGLAGGLELRYGFQAWFAGLGADLAVPFGTVGLNVYYRYTALQLPATPARAFNVRVYDQTWQVTPTWTIPFSLGKAGLVFQGLVDVDGVKNPDGSRRWELSAKPQLLVDALGLAGGPRDVLLAGVAWYLHYHSGNVALGAPRDLDSAPQAMLQWNLP